MLIKFHIFPNLKTLRCVSILEILLVLFLRHLFLLTTILKLFFYSTTNNKTKKIFFKKQKQDNEEEKEVMTKYIHSKDIFMHYRKE